MPTYNWLALIKNMKGSNVKPIEEYDGLWDQTKDVEYGIQIGPKWDKFGIF